MAVVNEFAGGMASQGQDVIKGLNWKVESERERG